MTIPPVVLAGGSVPVDPDADTAREWLVRELAKPEYAAARPTWFDRLAGAVADWFASLTVNAGGGSLLAGIVVVLVVVVVLLVVAFVIFGLPRLRRRSAVPAELFGVDDTRSAASLRDAAEKLAAAGDYAGAIAEMFRAIARGLSERAVLTTTPGTTARAFADSASAAFPGHRTALVASARAFDEVRYLGRDGTAEAFAAVAGLESTIRATTPQLAGVPG